MCLYADIVCYRRFKPAALFPGKDSTSGNQYVYMLVAVSIRSYYPHLLDTRHPALYFFFAKIGKKEWKSDTNWCIMQLSD